MASGKPKPSIHFSNMLTNYLYIARSQADPKAKRHNVFKVGHSAHPLERIRTLGGSVSTDTYEPILIVALPRHVKDLHILSHRYIQKFVVCRHEHMRSKYMSVFGQGHADGIKRRREIVMFGPSFAVSRIKDLFRQVVNNISSQKGNYVCTDSECMANGGVSDCAVCLKFTTSLLNCISYQNDKNTRVTLHKRRRVIESVQAQLITLMSEKQTRKPWKGPSVGSFWLLRPFRMVRILSNKKRKRSSRVQVWEPSAVKSPSTLVHTLQSRFTYAVENDTLDWDQSAWQCVVHMKQFQSFCRILNVSDVNYGVQKWASSMFHNACL